MRHGVLAALLSGALLLAACSEQEEPIPQESLIEDTTTPVYDPGLEPAAASLALVPEDATVLVVTDFAELRLQLTASEVTSESRKKVRRSFWRAAEREAVLFSAGLLRPVDRQLRRRYDFTQDDVEWEAQFATPTGPGWILKLRDDLDLTGVERAVDAGFGPLEGAAVDPARSLVSIGMADAPEASWAADPDKAALVGPTATATYVDTACIPYDVAFDEGDEGDEGDLAPAPASDLERLDELTSFAVGYGTELVTVRFGPARRDVFDRARLPEVLPRTDPDFALGYQEPVADPSGGRIGYRLGDPDIAESLARERRLPFAVCAG